MFKVSRRFFAINYRDPKNPQVYLTIAKNGNQIGKLTFEVF